MAYDTALSLHLTHSYTVFLLTVVSSIMLAVQNTGRDAPLEAPAASLALQKPSGFANCCRSLITGSSFFLLVFFIFLSRIFVLFLARGPFPFCARRLFNTYLAASCTGTIEVKPKLVSVLEVILALVLLPKVDLKLLSLPGANVRPVPVSEVILVLVFLTL